MQSIIQEQKECYVCGTTANLHSHHIYRGAYRKNAEKRGMKVWLCLEHHTGSNEAVHNNKELDLFFKRKGQKLYEEMYGTREEFIQEFGRNYLD